MITVRGSGESKSFDIKSVHNGDTTMNPSRSVYQRLPGSNFLHFGFYRVKSVLKEFHRLLSVKDHPS